MYGNAPAVEGARVRGSWKVRLWDENNCPGPWSGAGFETGLSTGDWQGLWVDPETAPLDIPGDDAINAFARPNWEHKQRRQHGVGNLDRH